MAKIQFENFIIEDNRHLNCGLSIDSSFYRFVQLGYSTLLNEFYVNTTGTQFYDEGFEEYINEMNSALKAKIEAQIYFNLKLVENV